MQTFGVAVAREPLVRDDLVKASPCNDPERSLATHVGRDRDRGRSDGPGLSSGDERVAAFRLAGHYKLNRYLLGQRASDVEQLCGIAALELQFNFADRR
jgi:hypothetical protein